MPISRFPDNSPEVIEDRDALQHLHDRITDALEGFRVMAAAADVSFGPVVEEFVAMHQAQAATVANMLIARAVGDDPDDTPVGSVSRSAASVGALLTSLDAGALESIRSGEEHVMAAFERAIGGVVVPADAAVLSAMQDDLVTLLDETRDLG